MIVFTSIGENHMRIGLLGTTSPGLDDRVGLRTAPVELDVESRQKRDKLLDEAIAHLSPDTLNVIKKLDLSKVSPQQLRDVASDLYFDGQISRELASIFFSIGEDLSDDAEFDALGELRQALEFERRLPCDRYQFENMRLYQEGIEVATGLRELIDFLRSGYSLDVTV